MDPLNLILLIIVVFIGLRLRSVLGMRDDDEQPGTRKDAYRLNREAFENNKTTDTKTLSQDGGEPDGSPHEETPPPPPEAEVVTSAQSESETESEVAGSLDEPASAGRGLAFLRDSEPDFDEAGFLEGAARAYEMILTAFAADDLTPVSGFLGDEVAAGFDAAIMTRRDNGQQLVTRILRLDRPILDDARIDQDRIALDVRFRAELISFTCPAGAEIDDEALPAPATAHDVWTFARARHSDDLNWQLMATHSG